MVAFTASLKKKRNFRLLYGVEKIYDCSSDFRQIDIESLVLLYVIVGGYSAQFRSTVESERLMETKCDR
jgi:hypothetical protein